MEQLGLEEGIDCRRGASRRQNGVFAKVDENLGGRPGWDHVLTLDAAKQIAMVEKNDVGNAVRAYFIRCERGPATKALRALRREAFHRDAREAARVRQGARLN